MLKKLLPVLLAVLLCTAAAAESPMTFLITADMEFWSGPGTQYTQGAFHNTPPIPGEEATVLGRVTGADGQDWLFVRFTGHWFSQIHPAQYYLPAASVPACAGAPVLTFLSEPNALAVPEARIYADPEGTNYDGYLTPDDAGVTVLDVQGTIAYIEAVNPYGHPVRGYISTRDLVSQPGIAALPAAPEGTATLTTAHPLPLTHLPATDYAQTLLLPDGSLILRYGTIPADAPWGEAFAVIGPDGRLLANTLYRTHDGMEESTIERLLPDSGGFRITLRQGDEDAAVRETHYAPDGTLLRTDLRRYSGGTPMPCAGTVHYTIALGRPADIEPAEDATIPLRITTASGVSVQRNVPDHVTTPDISECNGLLLLPVHTDKGLTLLVFDQDGSLLADPVLPDNTFEWELQCASMADGRIALLLNTSLETWQAWYLDISADRLTPGPSFTVPYNRRVALLTAGGTHLLIAVSGVETQLLLVSDASRQLAATTPGMVLHAQTDGNTATLLLLQDGALRLERWDLQLP